MNELQPDMTSDLANQVHAMLINYPPTQSYFYS